MRLGDVITVNPESIRNGYPFEEIEYIDISSVGTGTLQGTQRLQIGGAPSRAKRIVRNGDTLLATVRPNLRSFWFARNPHENAIASTGFAVLRAGKDIDERFLYFTVTNQSFTDYLTANAKGAAYPAVDTDTIARADIFLPPLSTQRKIAAILSAYDDLIENNLRRIKILEEMAQNLYREWFIHFRYPGSEPSSWPDGHPSPGGRRDGDEGRAKLVDSPLCRIPVGWEVVPLGQLADQVRDGVNPDSVDPETPYFGLEHLPRKSIALSDWGSASEVQSTKLLFKKCDILFGKIRPYFHKVGVAPLSGVCSSDTIIIRSRSEDWFGLVLSCTSSVEFVEHATATSQGTKMPRANWDVLVKYQIPMPPQPLLGQFNEFMSEIVTQLHNFVFRNRTLRRTRDLLLPKLISGEVDVSELDISVPKEDTC